MSKGKQSKFLVIYFAVLGAGALGLGYMALNASSTAEDAEKNYKDKVAELDRLENAPLSRTKENADKKKGLVEDYVKQVQDLNNKLMAFQVPVNEAETSESFQKQLTDARDAVLKSSKERNVVLGDKFDLGMGSYFSEFPVSGAAGKLTAQLKSIVFLVDAAMEAGVLKIDSLTRTQLPFEKKETTAATTPGGRSTPPKPANPPKPTAKAAPAAKAAPGPLVEEGKVFERQPLTLTVTGRNRSILKFLEALANTTPETSPHFFVIRTLQVENEKKEGPPKTFNVETKEDKDPDDKDKVIKTDAQFLLGDEKVMLRIDLDLIRFVADSPAPADKAKPATKTASN